MIVFNKSSWLGTASTGVVQNKTFACLITTAPEGIFKGYSTVFSMFDPSSGWNDAFRNGQLILVAKALLHPSLTKAGRAKAHEIFLEQLNMKEAETVGFAVTIDALLTGAKNTGAIIDFIVHSDISDAIADLPQGLQATTA